MVDPPAPAVLRLASPFRPTDFPDRRLARRAHRTMHALAAGLLHGRRATPTLRRGQQRFETNARLDGARLLARSARVVHAALRTAPVILLCEDTMFARGAAPDAGPLRSGADVGYVSHHAVAVLPGTGQPCAWLGARVWTRAGAPRRAQDHKARPPADRESAKWAALRAAIHARLRAAGVTGRLVSVNDREGDCWASLTAARAVEVLTRAAQRRRLADGGTLRGALHRARDAGTLDLTVYVRTAAGRVTTRGARVTVRWTPVVLAPPTHDRWARGDAPLPVVALRLHEAAPPRGARPLRCVLLTTCPIPDDAAAREAAGWYGDRWGVEIANDMLKNALEVETAVRHDVHAFERALALAGPTAAQLGQWLALARATPSPAAADHLTAADRTAIAQTARYHGVPLPADPWTMADVAATLGKIGGGDVRPTRPAGWRVVLRGWQRVVEFQQIAAFVRREADRPRRRRTKRPRKSRAP